MNDNRLERREFIKGAAAGLVVLLAEEEALAGRLVQEPLAGPPVRFGVIGAGQWGKEILATLSRQPFASVTAVCDSYAPYLKKAQDLAPKATALGDYRQLLESKEVEAIVIATPTHQHREIALAALQAGKHVYCEAPLAATIEDARAIALAAQGASKQVFQAGLQGRSNALYQHILQFVRSGVLGNSALVTAQWNKKESWRRAAPTPEREQELNWRLSRKTSTGLAGEIGIHQLDLTSWYLRALPVAATGFGAIVNWNDNRDVPDTVQCVLEYPNNVRAIFTSTLSSSFSDSFTLFQGSNSSLMLREKRGWMIKEADSPLLGWEVYARKEPVHGETGICMVADATKLIEEGKEPGREGPLEPTRTALHLAFENFARSICAGEKPVCGPLESYQSTVVALKASEAILSGSRIAWQKSLFELSS
ncbi:MAG TPA: Gfo/Idh/MocA family oxidoreductase [Blastocatellia bacterium]|nr:Gfo/Idh/MocA family oxidoreductase [Blastocatellia bacterium]